MTTSAFERSMRLATMQIKLIPTRSFGKWKIIGKPEKPEGGKNWQIVCECECGKTQYVFLSNLTSGRSTQCRDCANKAGWIKRKSKQETKL